VESHKLLAAKITSVYRATNIYLQSMSIRLSLLIGIFGFPSGFGEEIDVEIQELRD